jgi:hypothetical protein
MPGRSTDEPVLNTNLIRLFPEAGYDSGAPLRPVRSE